MAAVSKATEARAGAQSPVGLHLSAIFTFDQKAEADFRVRSATGEKSRQPSDARLPTTATHLPPPVAATDAPRGLADHRIHKPRCRVTDSGLRVLAD